MDKRITDYSLIFKALGNEKRLEILEYLCRNGNSIVGVVALGVGIRPSVASHHLRILHRCGLLSCHESGRYTCYMMLPVRIRELISYLDSLNKEFG